MNRCELTEFKIIKINLFLHHQPEKRKCFTTSTLDTITWSTVNQHFAQQLDSHRSTSSSTNFTGVRLTQPLSTLVGVIDRLSSNQHANNPSDHHGNVDRAFIHVDLHREATLLKRIAKTCKRVSEKGQRDYRWVGRAALDGWECFRRKLKKRH